MERALSRSLLFAFALFGLNLAEHVDRPIETVREHQLVTSQVRDGTSQDGFDLDSRSGVAGSIHAIAASNRADHQTIAGPASVRRKVFRAQGEFNVALKKISQPFAQILHVQEFSRFQAEGDL